MLTFKSISCILNLLCLTSLLCSRIDVSHAHGVHFFRACQCNPLHIVSLCCAILESYLGKLGSAVGTEGLSSVMPKPSKPHAVRRDLPLNDPSKPLPLLSRTAIFLRFSLTPIQTYAKPAFAIPAEFLPFVFPSESTDGPLCCYYHYLEIY